MLKKPIEEEIISILKNYYGINVQAVQLLSEGADINACVYKVDAKTNSYFMKFKYGNHDEINLSIIRLLHDSGIKEIIYPITTVEGKLFQQLDDYRIIVYPFIPAPNGFTQNLAEKQWKQLGKALRKVHDISVPPLIQSQLRKETYSSKWREMVRSFYSKIEQQHLSDDKITMDFKSFFKQNIDKIHQLVDSAEELAKRIHPDLSKYVLCHSDVHAGNILVSKDDLFIIDWDEPMLAPKERDLMFIGGGVGNVWNKAQEIDFFYEGYGQTSIDKTLLSYYRNERIVEDIAEFGKELLSQVHGNQSRLEMFKHFRDMFNHNGVVEIALSTSHNTD